MAQPFKALRAEAKDILVAKAELALRKSDQAAVKTALLRKGWSAARADKAIASAIKIQGLGNRGLGGDWKRNQTQPHGFPQSRRKETHGTYSIVHQGAARGSKHWLRYDASYADAKTMYEISQVPRQESVGYFDTADEAEAAAAAHHKTKTGSLTGVRGMRKGHGVKCVKVKAPLASFDKRSIRTIVRGQTRILIGCPKGHWQPRKRRCNVGTRAYETITPGKCPRGSSGKTKP